MKEKAKALVKSMEPAFQQVMDNQTKMLEYARGMISPYALWATLEASAIRMPKLQMCSPITIVSGLIKCAELGLMPNSLNMAWLIPYAEHDAACRKRYYKNCQCKHHAEFQVGYKGLQHCATESNPEIWKWKGNVVYQQEIDEGRFSVDEINDTIRHEPIFGIDFNPKIEDIALAYNIAFREDGKTFLHWIRREEIIETMWRTKSKKYHKRKPTEEEKRSILFREQYAFGKKQTVEIVGPWQTDTIAMIVKAVRKKHCIRQMELSPTKPLGKAVQYDDDGKPLNQTVIRTFDSDYSVTQTEKPKQRDRVEVIVENEKDNEEPKDKPKPPKEEKESEQPDDAVEQTKPENLKTVDEMRSYLADWHEIAKENNELRRFNGVIMSVAKQSYSNLSDENIEEAYKAIKNITGLLEGKNQ